MLGRRTRETIFVSASLIAVLTGCSSLTAEHPRQASPEEQAGSVTALPSPAAPAVTATASASADPSRAADLVVVPPPAVAPHTGAFDDQPASDTPAAPAQASAEPSSAAPPDPPPASDADQTIETPLAAAVDPGAGSTSDAIEAGAAAASHVPPPDDGSSEAITPERGPIPPAAPLPPAPAVIAADVHTPAEMQTPPAPPASTLEAARALPAPSPSAAIATTAVTPPTPTPSPVAATRTPGPATPAPVATASVTPAATPSPTPSVTKTLAPSPALPAAPRMRATPLAHETYALVVAQGDCLRVREKAALAGAILGCVPSGTIVSVNDGATEADGYRWQKVASGKLVGWAVDVYLEPTTTPPPAVAPAPSRILTSDALRAALELSPWPRSLWPTVERIVRCESGGNLDAIGPLGHRGLLQVAPWLHGPVPTDAAGQLAQGYQVYLKQGWKAWACY